MSKELGLGDESAIYRSVLETGTTAESRGPALAAMNVAGGLGMSDQIVADLAQLVWRTPRFGDHTVTGHVMLPGEPEYQSEETCRLTWLPA